MKMLHLETLPKNHQQTDKYINTRLVANTQVTAATLQREVVSKTEFSITRRQLIELNKLHADSFTAKPGWLRQSFKLNQRRKKHLNNILYESGLSGDWCGHSCDMQDWAGMLHMFWHSINGVPKCL